MRCALCVEFREAKAHELWRIPKKVLWALESEGNVELEEAANEAEGALSSTTSCEHCRSPLTLSRVTPP